MKTPKTYSVSLKKTSYYMWYMVQQEVKDKRVYKLLQRGEDDASGPPDMARIAKSSYLVKDPFGDGGDSGNAAGLETEQLALLRSLQDRCHVH